MDPAEKPDNYWQAPEEEVVEAPEDEQPASRQLSASDSTVSWTAQEYVHPDKSPTWFILFVVTALGLIAADVFLLKSWTFSLLVVVMAVAIILFIRRPARTLSYGLSSSQGLNVGDRLYSFDEFKAFGLIKDGEHNSVMLIPRRRFAPGVSVYFPDEVGEKVVDILGQRLPMEDLKLDIIDVVVRKLRL